MSEIFPAPQVIPKTWTSLASAAQLLDMWLVGIRGRLKFQPSSGGWVHGQRGCMGRRVLHTRELVQEAGGVVGSQSRACEQQGGEKKCAAHGRNVAGRDGDGSPRQVGANLPSRALHRASMRGVHSTRTV